jgi:hypothetical protein
MYSNVNTATLNITGASATLNGKTYDCVVIGTCGTATSTAATLTVNCPTITINNTALPNGTQNIVYTTQTRTITGGTAPYTITATTGSLPTGLTASISGTNLQFTGTPTVFGTFTYGVQIADANACIATQVYTIVVNLPAPIATTATVASTTSFTANWTQVVGASGYLVDVNTQADFLGTVILNNQTVATNSFAISTGLTAGTTYFYRVRTVTSSPVTISTYSNTKAVSLNLPAGSGNALVSFTTGNQYVEINNNSLITNTFTIETWFKAQNTSPATGTRHFYRQNNAVIAFINSIDGTIQLQNLPFTFGITTPNRYDDNQWHHVAFVNDVAGNQTIIYVDGVAVKTQTPAIPFSITAGMGRIGGIPVAGTAFNGEMDEFRFYNVALDENTIRARMCKKLIGNESGLIANFRFDEANPSTDYVENRAVGANFDGLMVNAPTRGVSGAYIGDVSNFSYPFATTNSTDGKLTVTAATGTPDGVQVYQVNENPNSTSVANPLSGTIAQPYYGVFLVGGTSPTATITSTATASAENRIATRTVNSIATPTWSMATNNSLNTPTNTVVTATGQVSGEYAPAKLQSFYSKASTDWSLASTWTNSPTHTGADATPVAGGNYYIATDHTITVSTNNLVINNLTFDNIGTGTLGVLDLGTTTGHSIGTLATTSTTAKLRITAPISAIAQLPTVTTNTFASGGVGTIEFYGTNTYNLPTISNLGQFNPIVGNALPNLIFMDNSVKTLNATITTNGNVSVESGNVVFSSPTISTPRTITSTGAIGKTFSVKNLATLTLNGTNNFPSNFNGAYILEPNSTVTYATTSFNQTISALPTTYGNLWLRLGIATSRLKTLGGSITVEGNLILEDANLNFGSSARTVTVKGDLVDTTISSIITMQGTGLAHTLNLAGANNAITTLNTTANSGSIVNYNGLVNQQVFASPNYQNITFTNASTKILAGNISLAGNWTNNASAVTTTSTTVTFNGTSLQTIGGTTSTSFNGLTITNSLNVDLGIATAANTLRLNAGKLILGAFDLTVSTAIQDGAGTTTFGSNNYIVTNGIGKVIWNSLGTVSYLFPVGISTTSYTPITITPTLAFGNTSVRVRNATATTAIPATVNYVNVAWEINPQNPNLANIATSWSSGDINTGIIATSKGYLFNGTSWALSPLSGTITGTSATLTSVNIGANNALAVYSPTPLNYYSILNNGNWNTSGTWSIDNTLQHTGASCNCTPNDNAIVNIGAAHKIFVTNASDIQLNNTINLTSANSILNFGNIVPTNTITTLTGISGSKISLSAGTLPTVGTNTFASSGLGTVEFTGTGSYNLPTSANLALFNSQGTNQLPNIEFTGTAGIKTFVNDIATNGNVNILSTNIDLANFTLIGLIGKTLRVENGATLNIGNVSTHTNTFPANFTASLAATSNVQYRGGNQAIAALNYGNLSLFNNTKTLQGTTSTQNLLDIQIGTTLDFGISPAKTLTVGGNFNPTAALGTLIMTGADHILNLAGNTNQGVLTLTTDTNNSTVNYNGTTQTVCTGANVTYRNVNFTSSGTKSLNAGLMTVTKDLSIAAGVTLNAGANNIDIAGNWTNDGTYTSTNTVTFNGAGLNAQVIGGTQTTSFNNLNLSNTGAGLSLSIASTANGTVNFISGNILLNTFDFNVGTAATVIATPALSFSNTKMFVANGTATSGKLTKSFNTGTTTFIFPIGTGTVYSPATLSGVINAGAVSVRPMITTGTIPNANNANTLSRYWDITSTATLSSAGTWTFAYDDNELRPTIGNTSSYVVAHYDAITNWDIQANSNINTVAKTFTYNIPTSTSLQNSYTIGESDAFVDFVVRNTNNAGANSLRRAIENANIVTSPQIITFAIPNAPFIISPTTALPSITKQVTIDGTSQAGIEIDGTTAGTANGFDISGTAATGTEIKGLTIRNFATGAGIRANASSVNINNNTIVANATGIDIAGIDAVITNNLIGTNGTVAIPNTIGINVGASIAGTNITNNIVSGNITGVNLQANPFVFNNNKIGTNIAGNAPIGTQTTGIVIAASGITIGAANAGNENIIAGNTTGINVIANNAMIRNNFVGTNGTIAIANTTGINVAVNITGTNITTNTIAGNTTGLALSGNATIASNLIGLNNIANGVGVQITGSNNQIGDIGTGNTFTNNTTAIDIQAGANNNTIASNTITANQTGLNILGSSNRIGNVSANGNTITNNSTVGMVINGAAATANTILFNKILNNNPTSTAITQTNGISFVNAANSNMPAPIITGVNLGSSPLILTGTMNTTVMGAGNYRFQFFSNATNVNAQADTYIGEGTVTLAAGTAVTWTVTLNPPITTPTVGNAITTIATHISTFSTSSPISNPFFVACSEITNIQILNKLTTCSGTFADLVITLDANSVIGEAYNIDYNNDGVADAQNVVLGTDRTLRVTQISGAITFSSTKATNTLSGCSTLPYANTLFLEGTSLTAPIITSVRVINPTSCEVPNGKIIIKLANPRTNQSYDVDVNGVFGTEFSGLQVRADSTILIDNLPIGFVVAPSVAVWQNYLRCYGQAVPFRATLSRPNDIDSTKVSYVDPNWAEISPNFNSFVILEKSQDSISYDLVRVRDNRVIRTIAGNNNNLVFATDTLTATEQYLIYGTHIRSKCRRSIGNLLTVVVNGGIFAEDLDILREVYTSTKGDAWKTKWDFTQSFTTFIGVKVFGGRVIEIKLPNNNLDSILTGRVNSLRRLKILDISSNKLDFASVEPFVGRTFTFTYDKQDKVDKEEEYLLYVGQSINLKIKTGGTRNTYKWTKDGVDVFTTFTPNLQKNTVTIADAGVYSALITNSLGTNLTLQRRNIRLRVVGQIGGLDSMILVQLNDLLGGQNWINKWDRTKPVAQWHGVEMEGTKVLSINLANNNLVGKLPDIFVSTGILSDITYLNLSGNAITGTIPKTLANLKKLQYLDLSKNLLTGDIIPELATLTDLQTLWLSSNQFTSISAEIGKLAKLQNLLVNNNLLKTLPNELTNLLALRKLNIANNQLTVLPTGMEKLVNLQLLDISNNLLDILPNIFANMRNLTDFYAQNNLFKDLPASLSTLNTLQTFVIHSNFLDFGDLETLRNLAVINTTGAIYEPQDKVDVAQDLLFNLSQSIVLRVTTAGTANRYQWFKDGIAIGGATSATYTKNFPNLADAGIYTVQITNTFTQRLTLLRRDISVKVVCGNSNSISLSTQGTTRYCEGEKINTTIVSMITDTKLQAKAYQWFINGNRLAGEDKPTINVIREGEYNVQITDAEGCVYQATEPMRIELIAKPIVSIVLQTDNGNQLIKSTISNVSTNVKVEWYVLPINSQIAQQLQVSPTATEVKPIIAGTYYAIVTDAKGCPAKSNVLVINVVTGIEEDLFAQQLQIYPNPSNRYFMLQTDIPHNELALKLVNALGQNIEFATDSVAEKLRIDVDNLPSGVYVLEITKKQANGKLITVYKKLIKQ